MAARKSIIDIDVRDGSFQRFQALFQRYQQALSDTPNKWRQVGNSQAVVSSNFERQTAALMAQAQMAREKSKADDRQNKQLVQNDRLWTSMAHSTKAVAGNVVSATTALLRWTGILTGVTGLLGAGGLWGIDRMAANVGSQRRSSMGLGMSPGEQQAFQINFSRLVDTDSFLDKINEMRSNPAAAWPLAALGVSSAGTQEDVAVRTLDAMRAKAKGTQENQLGLLGSQTGMDVGIDTWRRLHDMPEAEYQELRAHNTRDIGSFQTSDSTNKGWQDLSNQFSRAKTTLFDSFQTRVGQLAPELTHLSDSLTGIGTKIINSPFAQDAVTAIGHGLDWLAAKIDDPGFQSRIEQFFSENGPLATGVKRFSDAVSGFADAIQQDLPEIAKAIHAVSHPLDAMESSDNPAISLPAKAVDYTGRGIGIGAFAAVETAKETTGLVGAAMDRRAFLAHPTKDAYLQRLDELSDAFQLPPKLLRYQWRKESSEKFSPADSAKGAMGPFQINAITARDIENRYGTRIDPRDPLSAALGAAEYDQYLLKKYKGDVDKAVAAYNLGPQSLDDVLKAHPKDWQKYLPAEETRDYVSSYQQNSGTSGVLKVQPPGVTIRLDNQTGGSTTATVSALAQ